MRNNSILLSGFLVYLKCQHHCSCHRRVRHRIYGKSWMPIIKLGAVRGAFVITNYYCSISIALHCFQEIEAKRRTQQKPFRMIFVVSFLTHLI